MSVVYQMRLVSISIAFIFNLSASAQPVQTIRDHVTCFYATDKKTKGKIDRN